MNITQLRAALAYVEAALRDIHTAAEGRTLDADEQTRWDEGVAYVDATRAQIADLEAREAVVARIGDGTAVTRPGDGARDASFQIMERVDPFDSEVRYLRDGEARDRGLKALETRAPEHLTDEQRAKVERLVRRSDRNHDGANVARMILATENDAYRSAFQKGVTETNPVWTPDEARAVQVQRDLYRAMSIGTDGAGGFGVPVLIDPSVVLTAQGSSNAILNISRVETITNDEWRGVTSAGVSWSFDAEAAEASDDSPTLAQPTVAAHKAQGFIPYSIEVGGDYPGFAEEMSRLLMEGYDELLAQKLAVGAGNGSNEPFGIITALDANTNVEVTPTTDGTFTAVDIYKVWKALPERYRSTSSWVMNVDVNNEIRGLGDDKLHQQTVNLTEGAVDRLMGRPVFENAYFPEFTGTTGAANILVVGDFRNYLVAQRLGMTIELVPHLFATGNNRPSGQRGWYAYARVGADSINDLGFRLLQNQ